MPTTSKRPVQTDNAKLTPVAKLPVPPQKVHTVIEQPAKPL